MRSSVVCRPPSVGWLSHSDVPPSAAAKAAKRAEAPRITQNPEFTPIFELDGHLNTLLLEPPSPDFANLVPFTQRTRTCTHTCTLILIRTLIHRASELRALIIALPHLPGAHSLRRHVRLPCVPSSSSQLSRGHLRKFLFAAC